MSDSMRGLVGGLTGAFLGALTLAPGGAMVGWFLGSTIGTLMGIQGETRENVAERQTDFKSMNSKYGIPIPKGFGTARVGGNLVWAGPVTEEEVVEIDCIDMNVFFFFNITIACTINVYYRYYQSGAIAFAAGPGCGILKMWADGQVVYDVTPNSVEEVATVAYAEDEFSPCHPENKGPFTTYPGTATQKIDPLVKKYLGPEYSASGLDEAYAFRHIIYAVYNQVDIGQFGFKLPVLSALVNFEPCGQRIFTNLDESLCLVETNGSTASLVWPMAGKVQGRLDLVGQTNNECRAVYNLRNRRSLFEDDSTRAGMWDMFDAPLGTSLVNRIELSANFVGPDGGYISNDIFMFGVADWLTKRFVNGKPAVPESRYDRIGYHFYDIERAGFWMSFSEGNAVVFIPMAGIPREEEAYEEGVITSETDIFTGVDVNDVVTSGSGTFFGLNPQTIWTWHCGWVDDGEYGFKSVDCEIKFIFPDNECNIWVVSKRVNGSGLYIDKINGETFSFDGFGPDGHGVEFYFSDGVTEVPSGNAFYCPTLDKIFISVGGSGAFSSGTYKVDRSLLDAQLQNPASGFVTLPDQSDPEVFTTTSVWGDWYAVTGTYLIIPSNVDGMRWFDLELLQYETDLGRDGTKVEDLVGLDGGTLTYTNPFGRAIHYSHLDATLVNSYTIIWWRSPKATVLLSDVVTRIMTTVNNDPRVRLSASDLDVSELTDAVNGYVIRTEVSARDALAQLQQAYMFDAVETDGKIFFPKRGRAEVFSLVEDEMMAHDFGTSKDLVPLSYSRSGEVELPREVSIEYADIDKDYIQESQRSRRSEFWESESNASISFSISMDRNKAAQVADILLKDFWMAAVSPYVFQLGPKWAHLNPADVGTVTMNNGTSHRVRINSLMIGANGVVEVVATREDDADVYTSTAEGVDSGNLEKDIYSDNIELVMTDVTSRVVNAGVAGFNQPGILVGISTIDGYGETCYGGAVYTIDQNHQPMISAAVPQGQCSTWGIATTDIGHMNYELAYGSLDTETQIIIRLMGGDYVPESATLDEILLGNTNLIIVDTEIIAFQDVQLNHSGEVFISDLEGVKGAGPAGQDVLRTTVHDFVALGIEPGGLLIRTEYVSGFSMHPNARSAWNVFSVTPTEIILSEYGTASYNGGGRPGINFGPNAAYLSSGFSGTATLTNLLRGLYGTEFYQYHQHGAKVYAVEGLKFGVIDPPDIGMAITGFAAQPIGKATTARPRKSIAYQASNLKPWSPFDVTASGTTVSWYRRDKYFSDGVVPQILVPTETSERAEGYEVVVLEGLDQATAGEIVYRTTVTSIPPISGAVTGSVPLLAAGKQIVQIQHVGTMDVGDNYIIRSEPWRNVLAGDNVYADSGIDGEILDMWDKATRLTFGKRPSGTYGNMPSFATYYGDRYDTFFSGKQYPLDPWADYPSVSIGSGASVSGARRSGVQFKEAGPVVDAEVLAIFPTEPRGGNTIGVFLRGYGYKTDGALLSCILNRTNNSSGYRFEIYQVAGNKPSLLDTVAFDWKNYISAGLYFGSSYYFEEAYAIRFRVYKSRVQGKVWKVTDAANPATGTEPSNWMLDAYIGHTGPHYGSCGITTTSREAYCTYFSWGHRGATAP